MGDGGCGGLLKTLHSVQSYHRCNENNRFDKDL